MNGDEQFETQLRGQPQRRVPAEWRAEILKAARESAAVPGQASRADAPRWASFGSLLANLLWPHPRAWAGLAAVWLAVFGFNLATREAPQPRLAGAPPPPLPVVRQMVQQRERMLAELVDLLEPAEANFAKPIPAQPRSQRNDPFLNA